jgi:hypothetical protein
MPDCPAGLCRRSDFNSLRNARVVIATYAMFTNGAPIVDAILKAAFRVGDCTILGGFSCFV